MRLPFYRVVNVLPDGTEETVRDILWKDTDDRSDERAIRKGRDTQVERAEAFEEAHRLVEEGQHIRVYSSQDDGSLGPDDLIWDSEKN